MNNKQFKIYPGAPLDLISIEIHLRKTNEKLG